MNKKKTTPKKEKKVNKWLKGYVNEYPKKTKKKKVLK